MTEECDEAAVSAEEFDPYSFAERWLDQEWPQKRPHEFACYISAAKRWESK